MIELTMSNLYMEDCVEVKIYEEVFEIICSDFLAILLNEKSKMHKRIGGMLFLRNRLEEIKIYTCVVHLCKMKHSKNNLETDRIGYQ